jgi:hypothetical protein
MNKSWFCRSADKVTGPHSAKDIEEMLRTTTLLRTDFCRREARSMLQVL